MEIILIGKFFTLIIPNLILDNHYIPPHPTSLLEKNAHSDLHILNKVGFPSSITTDILIMFLLNVGQSEVNMLMSLSQNFHTHHTDGRQAEHTKGQDA